MSNNYKNDKTPNTADKTKPTDIRRRALIIVDVQNDFCEGGSLAVAGGLKCACDITKLTRGVAYKYVLATRDAHIDPGGHFAAEGMSPDFQDTWPVHCVMGTQGFEYAKGLNVSLDFELHKGGFDAAYSGFEAHNTADPNEMLEDVLGRLEIDGIDVCGIAGDVCVAATVHGALDRGWDVRVIGDLCPGVSEDNKAVAMRELADRGAVVTTAWDVTQQENNRLRVEATVKGGA